MKFRGFRFGVRLENSLVKRTSRVAGFSDVKKAWHGTTDCRKCPPGSNESCSNPDKILGLPIIANHWSQERL